MGGSISVESAPGRGSKFCVQLPYDIPLAPKPPETDFMHDWGGIRVLVVDDLESNRTIVEQYVGSWQMKSDSAENGLQAITKIREAAQSGQPYGLVVLDCGMPGVSGIDVARIVAADRKILGTPMIMLTSYDDRNEVQAAKDVGILAFLTKPVRKQSLFKGIVKALAPKPFAPLTPGEPATRPKTQTAPRLKHGTRLLLVEDNEDNQKLAIRLLEKYGFICEIASNGLEAMAKLAQQSYPLVLMDCQMPLMDGFETAMAIRKQEHEGPRRTPIIAMTAHALPEDREKCLAAGMDDYLSKPINERHLVKAIQRWLLPADANPEAAPVSADRIQVRAKEGLEDMIPGYLANRRHDLVALSEAVNRGDLPAARTIGHGMKGSGTGYGFPAISEIGRSIEQCANRRDAAGILQQVSSLEEYLSRLEVVS